MKIVVKMKCETANELMAPAAVRMLRVAKVSRSTALSRPTQSQLSPSKLTDSASRQIAVGVDRRVANR